MINLISKLKNILSINSFNGNKYSNRDERMIAYNEWKIKKYGKETMKRIDEKNKTEGLLWKDRNYETIKFYEKYYGNRYRKCA